MVLETAPSVERQESEVMTAGGDYRLHPHEWYIRAVADRLRQWPQPEWLDLGCGWHFDWPWQEEREKALMSQANVVGLDPDWQAICRHRTIRTRVVAFVETLPFASASFDLVTANVVVEHLKYPCLAFSEIFRVLKPHGCFLFRTPSARSYFVRIARRLPQGIKVKLASGVVENRPPEDIYPAHYRVNTKEVVEDVCRTVGFSRVNVLITRARGVLMTKAPRLARLERFVASALGLTEGNLIVEALK